MKRSILLLTAIIGVYSVLAQESVNKAEVLKEFVTAEWKTVKAAKTELENLESDIIPDIIQLMKEDKTVKLQNTGSLIYPGADRFYGYGQIIEYDIDQISVRAGWLLEELTFGNFGFGGVHLPADQLENFIKVTFPTYYNNSTNRKKVRSAEEEELSSIVKQLSIDKATEWWSTNKESWTRLNSLLEALQSYDEKRQVKALFYIRNGATQCTGLTKDYYIENLYREVVRLSSSDVKRVSEHAISILQDYKFDWLEFKSQE